MNDWEIKLTRQDGSYIPGETIEGVFRWKCDPVPRNLAIRLFWYTTGRGTQDTWLDQEEVITLPDGEGERRFSFVAPEGPSSFSGKLVSIVWAIEGLDPAKDEAVRRVIFISPVGKEILGIPGLGD